MHPEVKSEVNRFRELAGALPGYGLRLNWAAQDGKWKDTENILKSLELIVKEMKKISNGRI